MRSGGMTTRSRLQSRKRSAFQSRWYPARSSLGAGLVPAFGSIASSHAIESRGNGACFDGNPILSKMVWIEFGYVGNTIQLSEARFPQKRGVNAQSSRFGFWAYQVGGPHILLRLSRNDPPIQKVYLQQRRLSSLVSICMRAIGSLRLYPVFGYTLSDSQNVESVK